MDMYSLRYYALIIRKLFPEWEVDVRVMHLWVLKLCLLNALNVYLGMACPFLSYSLLNWRWKIWGISNFWTKGAYNIMYVFWYSRMFALILNSKHALDTSFVPFDVSYAFFWKMACRVRKIIAQARVSMKSQYGNMVCNGTAAHFCSSSLKFEWRTN